MKKRYPATVASLAVATALFAGSAHSSEPVTANDVDNSKVNVRDKHDTTTLPTDQPNNSADLKVAAAVRSAIVDDDSLSMSAHNVKLVAVGGVVVLRGPVDSQDEKTKVGKIAGAIAGVSKVENHLEIKTP